MQVRQVLEVVGEAVAKVFGLADVDDATLRIGESVDARRGRNVSVRVGTSKDLPRSQGTRQWLAAPVTLCGRALCHETFK